MNTPTKVTPKLTPLDAFYQREQQQAEDICFVQPYPDGSIEKLTWAEVGEQVRRIAAYLQSQNLDSGSRIALMSNNCCHWIIADLAIMMSGHVSVPLYPTLTASSIRQILEHSNVRMMFAGKLVGWNEMKEGVPEDITTISFPLSAPEICVAAVSWQTIIDETLPITDNPKRAMNDLATIIYTSGTTGTPKGVMHSFGTMATTGELSGLLYSTDSNDRMLSYLPLSHVAERAAAEICQLYYGYTIYFANSLETFADDLRRARPTIFFAVPRIWNKLQQRVLEKIPEKRLQLLLRLPVIAPIIQKKLTKALGMDKLRIGLSGAAPLSTALLAWYQQLNIFILEGYAMSENFAYSHITKLGHSKIGYVGSACPYVKCKISEQGEILINSPTNMLGYYKQPDLTSEVIDVDGFVHTGDKGEVDDQGRLKITGRIKEIFKTSKGKYVAPAPIEDLLMRNTNFEQVCVTGPDLPQPIVLVTLSEQAAKNIKKSDAKEAMIHEFDQLLQETNSMLDKHENLSHIIAFTEPWSIEKGLVTPTLKIKRNEIEKQFYAQFDQWQNQNSRVIVLDTE